MWLTMVHSVCWADNQQTHQYGKILALLKQSRFNLNLKL